MKMKKTDILMITLISISAFVIFVGAIFKLEHWMYGDVILKWGVITNLLFGSIEIWRLRKIIAKLKGEDNHRNHV